MIKTIVLLAFFISTTIHRLLDYRFLSITMLFAAHSAAATTATSSLNPLINKCKRIAICGCGVTGSIISNLLSKHDPDRYSIHVFEAGRGPGGRSATRHYEGFNFDHGANYIKVHSNQPSTSDFQSWLNTMVSAGVIAQWSGLFQDYHMNNPELFSPSVDQVRYVGYPSMSSICRHLVNEVKINTAFSQRIKAHYGMNRRWMIVDEATDNILLDEVDWLISTDQSSFVSLTTSAHSFMTHNRAIHNNSNKSSAINSTTNAVTTTTTININNVTDNTSTPTPLDVSNITNDNNIGDDDYVIYEDIEHLLSDRKSILSNVNSSPALVAMIALQTKIPHDLLPFDSLSIPLLADRQDLIIKSITRNNSKPGRSRSDNKECWVVQSTAAFARNVILDIKQSSEYSSASSDEIKRAVNKRANEILVTAFIETINNIIDSQTIKVNKRTRSSSSSSDGESNNSDICTYHLTNSEVEVSIGHRWGAAFPNRNCSTEQYAVMLNQLQGKAVDGDGKYKHCYINKNINFIAAGDYFHDDADMIGTIESSFLSSQDTVDEVVDRL